MTPVLTQNFSDSFSDFMNAKKQGLTPHQAYFQAKRMQFDTFKSIRMLRIVFDLDLPSAKEVMIQTDDLGEDILTYQETLLPIFHTLHEQEVI